MDNGQFTDAWKTFKGLQLTGKVVSNDLMSEEAIKALDPRRLSWTQEAGCLTYCIKEAGYERLLFFAPTPQEILVPRKDANLLMELVCGKRPPRYLDELAQAICARGFTLWALNREMAVKGSAFEPGGFPKLLDDRFELGALDGNDFESVFEMGKALDRYAGALDRQDVMVGLRQGEFLGCRDRATGRVVASLRLQALDSKRTLVGRVVTNECWRGAGLASALMAHVAQTHSNALLTLWVNEDNPARKLYVSRGFVETGKVCWQYAKQMVHDETPCG